MTHEDFYKLQQQLEAHVTYDESTLERTVYDLSRRYKYWQDIAVKAQYETDYFHAKLINLHGILYDCYRYPGKHKKVVFEYHLDKKNEIEEYINANEEYIELWKVVEFHKSVVKYCEQAMHRINVMGHEIRALIDLRKLKAGLL